MDLAEDIPLSGSAQPDSGTPVQLLARSAGALYLLVIAGGMFAEFFVRSALVVRGDAAATAANILAYEQIFRLGLVADLVAAAAYVGVTFLLYQLFRPVSSPLASLSLVLGVGGSVIMAGNLVNFHAPLVLLKSATSPMMLEVQQAQALASLRLHGIGYNISAMFFGAHLFTLGILTFRSSFLPRGLGLLLTVAGPAWLIYLFAIFLSPPAAGNLFPYVPLLSLIAEGALALWLLTMGVNSERWRRRLR